MKVKVARNHSVTWLVADDRCIALRYGNLKPRYAIRLLYKFLRYYLNLNRLGIEKKLWAEIPDNLVARVLALYDAIEQYECNLYPGFRDKFDKVKAKTPEQFVEQMEKITRKYVTYVILTDL